MLKNHFLEFIEIPDFLKINLLIKPISGSLGMGKGSQKAGYYLHIEPGKSFLGGGIYMPESSVLKSNKKRNFCFGDEFKRF